MYFVIFCITLTCKHLFADDTRKSILVKPAHKINLVLQFKKKKTDFKNIKVFLTVQALKKKYLLENFKAYRLFLLMTFKPRPNSAFCSIKLKLKKNI